MKVTTLPYIPPRKARRHESTVAIVKWKQGNMMQFRAFKRDNAAVAFLNRLIDDGYTATITAPKDSKR